MLDLIIGSHPECVSVGELCLLHRRECGLCGSTCIKWQQYRATVRGDYYKTAFEVFNTDIIVDSSKKWRWLLDRMKNEKYDYKIIHLVRNGLDRLKAKKRLEGHIEKKIVQGWINTHRVCEKIRRKKGGILVKYEELSSQIRAICDFIGIPYRPEMKAFWRFEHHGLLGSKTAYALVREHHKVGGEHMEYVKSHGLNLKPRLGHDFLDKKDLRVFRACGGYKLNKELGYE